MAEPIRHAALLAAAVRCMGGNVDDAGCLFMRCVQSPGATQILLANIIVTFLAQKIKPNPKNNRRYALSSDLESDFWKLRFCWDRENRH